MNTDRIRIITVHGTATATSARRAKGLEPAISDVTGRQIEESKA